MIITQLGIAMCGATAVFLSQDRRPERRRWSSVLGMLGQPFWFVEAYSHQQWGVLALTALYTYGWGRGIFNTWISPKGNQ